jgi:hypothetical protein
MLKAILTTLSASFLATAMLNGCIVHDEYPPDEVYVAHGYYYDTDYYDSYGIYHPRSYWYYDGHSYLHRDALPHGEAAHLRANVAHGSTRHEEVHNSQAPHANAGYGGGHQERDDHGP